jgi:hypothetical protein
MSSQCKDNQTTLTAAAEAGEAMEPAVAVVVAEAADEAAHTKEKHPAHESRTVGMCKNANWREHINQDLHHKLPRCWEVRGWKRQLQFGRQRHLFAQEMME